MSGKPTIRPVILSGGAGKRLWPVSRAMYPKQFQHFTGDKTLIQETALRVSSGLFSNPLIICNEEHRFIVGEQMAECGITPADMILEPESRGTLPAIILAALWMQQNDPEGLMLILPSDHVIERDDDFVDTLNHAQQSARDGNLVLFGVSASSIQPEFGHIQPEATHANLLKSGAGISGYMEKPDAKKAEDMLARGALWNSGIFLLTPQTCLEEAARQSDGVIDNCRAALDQAQKDLDFLRLSPDPFLNNPVQSFYKLILENTQRAIVFLLESGWQDLRMWPSFYENAQASDKQGNVIEGDVITGACESTYIRSDNMLTAAIGLKNMAIIATDDAVLVTNMDDAARVDSLMDGIAQSGTEKHLHHPTIYRPWGSFRSILSSDEFQVKELVVKPGASLSLQKHMHRSEHWVVVEGTAKVTCDDEEKLLHENQSSYIPLGAVHRLANPGRIPLRVVEVQSGSYLGEDDIIRIEDTYGRH